MRATCDNRSSRVRAFSTAPTAFRSESSTVALGEAERACVFRMGRFYRVAGPGAVFSIPLIDHLAVVDLDRTIPEWREAYPEEVNAMVEFLVTRYPKVPSHLSLEEIREAIYPSAGGSDPSG